MTRLHGLSKCKSTGIHTSRSEYCIVGCVCRYGALVLVAAVAAVVMLMAKWRQRRHERSHCRGRPMQWRCVMATSEDVRGRQRRCLHNRRARLYVGCVVGANESVGLARPIITSRGRGESSAVANAPVSHVSPDPLGLAGTVMKVDIDAREVDPRH